MISYYKKVINKNDTPSNNDVYSQYFFQMLFGDFGIDGKPTDFNIARLFNND
jgi:hypothetical protein